MGGVTHAISSGVQTVTHSVGAAVDSGLHGDIIGAVSSAANAVNPVAVTASMASGQVTTNSADTMHIMTDGAKKAVGIASNVTGLSPQEITGAGMAVATGGVSALGDIAAGAVGNAITPKSTPVSTANPAIGPRQPAPATVIQSGGGIDSTTMLVAAGGLAAVVLLSRR